MSVKQIKNGFTIVEIMIVVAIIGSLVAIVFPNYYQYIADAQKNACLTEVKVYSDHIFYALNDMDDNTNSIPPSISACQSITDATNWTLETQQKIFATAKSPSNARIECDIPNGTPCIVLP